MRIETSRLVIRSFRPLVIYSRFGGTSAGTPLSCGAVVSTRVMVWLAEVSLPQRSVAVHVRTSWYVPGQGPPTVVSEKPTAGPGSQSSVAVTAGGAGTASHSTVSAAGTPTSTGASPSTTVTTWTWVVAFAQIGNETGRA